MGQNSCPGLCLDDFPGMDSDHTLPTDGAMSTGEGEGQGRNKSQCQDPNTLLGPHTVTGHPWLRTLAPWALPPKGHLISVKSPRSPGAFPQPLAVPTSSPLNAQAPLPLLQPRGGAFPPPARHFVSGGRGGITKGIAALTSVTAHTAVILPTL